MMYRINICLTKEEFMELASMSMSINGWPESAKESDFYSCLMKIQDCCLRQCSRAQYEELQRVFHAIQHAFGQPSVERGMVQGGLIGLMDRVNDELDNIDH